jgi:hypothetical protein
MESGIKRRMTSLEEAVFYSLSASEFWFYKRDGL